MLIIGLLYRPMEYLLILKTELQCDLSYIGQVNRNFANPKMSEFVTACVNKFELCIFL